ncbi:hypothetical protein JYT54_00515 [bacterium AH-315-A03]|nr:hypothetical protein [bacterium AH-315-A03]
MVPDGSFPDLLDGENSGWVEVGHCVNGLLVNAFLAKHRQEVVNQMLIAMSTVRLEPRSLRHVLRDK